MGRPRKTDNEKEADRKGESRMARYEQNQSASKAEPKKDTTEKSIDYWEKVNDGPWDLKTYTFTVEKK